jgi:DNA-binding MarR family transcriptional regulator
LLRVPYDRLTERLYERLRAEGFDDLTPAHHLVFQHPGPEGLRPSQLAAQRRVTKQTMNEIIRHLCDRDYLTLELDPDDARARRLAFTRRGRRFVERVRAIVTEVEKEWAQRMGAKRYREMRAALAELAELVGGDGDGDGKGGSG